MLVAPDGRRRMVGSIRVVDTINGVEVRYSIDGQLRFSQLYRGTEAEQVKNDLMQKHASLRLKGWTPAPSTGEPVRVVRMRDRTPSRMHDDSPVDHRNQH